MDANCVSCFERAASDILNFKLNSIFGLITHLVCILGIFKNFLKSSHEAHLPAYVKMKLQGKELMLILHQFE